MHNFAHYIGVFGFVIFLVVFAICVVCVWGENKSKKEKLFVSIKILTFIILIAYYMFGLKMISPSYSTIFAIIGLFVWWVHSLATTNIWKERMYEINETHEEIYMDMAKNRKGFVYILPKLIVKYKDANYIERLSRIICNATEPKESNPYDNQLDELYLSYLFSEAFIEDKPFDYRMLWKVMRTENTYKELDSKLKRLKNKEASFEVYDFEEEVTTYESISNYCLERLMYFLGGREENVEKMRDRVKKRLNAYLSLETAIRLNDVLSWLDENGVEIK